MSLEDGKKAINYFTSGLGSILSSIVSSSYYFYLSEPVARKNLNFAIVEVVVNRFTDSAIFAKAMIEAPDTSILAELKSSVASEKSELKAWADRPITALRRTDPAIEGLMTLREVREAKNFVAHVGGLSTKTSPEVIKLPQNPLAAMVTASNIHSEALKVSNKNNSVTNTPPPARMLARNSPAEHVTAIMNEIREVNNVADSVRASLPTGFVTLETKTPSIPVPPVPPPPMPPPIVESVRVPISEDKVEMAERTLADNTKILAMHVKENVKNMTNNTPLTPRSEAMLRDSLVSFTREVNRSLGRVGRAPIIPIVEIHTVYGPEYTCPIEGSVFYTKEELERHAALYHPEHSVV
ncbi:MAG: hypothetical protein QW272_09685 [Candidatus Methanomethylicaceae archaeon]